VNGFLGAWRRLRPWSQPAIYIGAAVIAAIWASVSFNLAIERERSLQSSIQSTGNLARVFEENIVRTLMEADRAMVLLRSSYQQSGNFDLAKSLGILENDLLAQIRIVGPDGILISTNTGPISAPVDVHDREYFQVQQAASTDELFISKPILGRTRGIWLLQLSRAIRGADGSFHGVIVASLDPRYLAKFYESIDLGSDGVIFLAGLDGVVRASAGFKSDVVGDSMLGSNLFENIKRANTGWFLTAGTLDGVRRFVSYRVVKGHPLVVYLGQSQREVLAIYRSNQESHYAVAGGATLLIVIMMLFAVRYRGGLNAAQAALQASEASARNKSLQLEVTLEHMNQGIMMVDADRNVVVMNRRVIDLLGLPEDCFGERLRLADVQSHLLAKGELELEGSGPEHGTPSQIVSDSQPTGFGFFERARPNGMTLEIYTKALPDGGVVRTVSDVTERKRKEVQIAHMVHHDALTDLANRTMLNERVAQALARMRRKHEGFALFYLDLDRFKAVNDMHGHPAGDALLLRLANRLSACARETDTIARLGGDEFAILLDATSRKEDAEVLAKRILEAVGTPYYFDGYNAMIGISIGIAMAPGDGTSAEELFKAADTALYRAKTQGGNAYEFFAPVTDAGPVARLVRVGR
jgi:diguanylate cyclase (GGDEF)-like protein